MAGGSDLFQALMSTQMSPGDTPYGAGAKTLASATPYLVNPYGSVGSNLGITAGAGLLSALLGGLAQNDAQAENARIAPIRAEFLQASPQQQMMMVQKEPRLSALQAALLSNDIDTKHSAATAAAVANAQLPIDLRKAQANKVLDLLAQSGKTLDKNGNEMQIFDPINQAGQEASARKIGEIQGERAATGGRALSPKQIADLEVDYTTRLTTNPQAAGLVESQNRAKQVLEALKTKDPLGAATAIYGFAKVLDPQGVVRKEDGTIVADPGGPAGQLASLYNQMLNKGRITDETATAMKRLVPELLKLQYQSYASVRDAMVGAAEKQGAIRGNIGFIPEADLSSLIGDGGDAGALAELRRRGVIK